MSRRPPKQSGLSFTEFERQIRRGDIAPLYLFTGDEEYLHDQAINLLFSTVDEALRQFNVAIFTIGSDSTGTGSKVSAAAAIDSANMLPMMGPRRIVVIRDFDKIKEGELDVVLEYLKRPSDSATVVFQTRGLDQRRKITAALIKSCTVVSLDQPSDAEATKWSEAYLKKKGCTIDRQALGALVGLTGHSMSRLAREMDKITTYTGGGQISLDTVEQLVPRAREHTSFELWDPIMSRDRKKALRIVRRLVEDGAEPVGVIGALGSLYRKLLLAKDLMAKGARADEVAKATGQYGPRSGEFNTKVRRLSREEIVHGIRRIAQTDNDIKNSIGTPELMLEFLVAELTIPESTRWN